jgi:hypothetical protein
MRSSRKAQKKLNKAIIYIFSAASRLEAKNENKKMTT